ncbi:hypothetical protein [Propionimicrobium sp. PCR01-08-3]|uniref:hypothetical protein n=1 Tax=Propionimicrobium sp. PCR01-08-3 TaxID=3052086 RepID=UPI00255C5F38|nr:hypothetical protein [Propionimicrobium sp. PCR01-08-3]WIY83073.1 hypothetical protein QQ658_01540 [Propionimicrobium sp. PCR01-08-3]
MDSAATAGTGLVRGLVMGGAFAGSISEALARTLVIIVAMVGGMAALVQGVASL